MLCTVNRGKGQFFHGGFRPSLLHPQLFRPFFLFEVRPLLVGPRCDLSEVYVGRSKDLLDRVNSDLVIAEVVWNRTSWRGRLSIRACNCVCASWVCLLAWCTSLILATQPTRTSCLLLYCLSEELYVMWLFLQIFMTCRRPVNGEKTRLNWWWIPSCNFPSRIVFQSQRPPSRNLMNDVISFLKEKNCKWRGSEVSSAGNSLVTALTDTLWVIDGHHHVISNQGHKIPPVFSRFVGYNKPELSKHRKRQSSNMSGTVLQSLSSHLFHCLQGGYWHRCNWVHMKTDVEQLAQTLSKYTDYLEASRKKTKLNQFLLSI